METMKQKDAKFYLIVFVTAILMFGFGFLPTFGEVTPQGMKILGIFLGCIFAWCMGETVWSSILGLVLLGIFGFGTMNGNFASAFANGTVATMLVAIIFCYAIEHCGLLKEIAKWIVGQKWAQSSPWALVFAFYLAALILGAMATNAVPAIILLWALFYEMADELGIQPYDKFGTIILLGIGVADCVGVSMMPYSVMVVCVKGCAEALDPTFAFNIGQFMLMMLLMAVIFLPLIVFVLRFLFGSKIDLEIPQKAPYQIQLTSKMKFSLLALIVLILSMLIPNFLPDGNIIKEFFGNRLGIVGIFMLLSALLMIIHVQGGPVLDICEGIRNIPWSLMLLVSSALAISGFLTADGIGILPTIVSFLDALMAGKSALTITLLFIVIGLVMTNLINDMVTTIVLYPIAAQFIIGAGGSVMLFAILFAQVTVQGCLMPSGSVIGAMFHGNTAWMKSKDIFQYVAVMELVVLVVLLIVSLIGNLLGI